ncbi:MAG: arylamine N-acetyltransferase [Betaproteobacteria bacterium]
MENGLDLDAYFDRIQWGDSTRPTYETLAGVLRAHMSSIPFENLDVLLGRPIRLDLDGVQQKLVRARRGGYCFEHGTLFGAVLEEMRFKPVRHTARVVMATARTAAPRTHMFLTVTVAEGTFVVDPGFGSLAPRIPVPLADGVEARIGPETHWIARDRSHWILRTRTAGKDTDCWVSTLEEDNPVDFEVGSHYVATHPSSPFVNRMLMRALTADGRVTVMNRDVNVRSGNVSEPVQLVDRTALRTLLITYFGFDLPEVEQMTVPSIPEWR